MTDVFEGPADARQASADEPAPKITRFRPRYRQLTDEEKALHDALKAAADGVEQLINAVDQLRGQKGSRYTALAITALEQAIMWAVKELTS